MAQDINSMKLPKFFNQISTKVAIVIIIMIVALFISLDFLVVDRGARTFNDIYNFAQGQGTLPPEDVPFIIPTHGGFLFGQASSSSLTPPEHFRTRFQSSLIFIGLIALAGAFGIGFLTSRIVTKPLKKLGTGLKKLRQSHYLERLDEDDSEEFNNLIREFNGLAAELQRVEELRKNLISDTSHELKTPLASLTAQLEGIDDGVLTLDKDRVKLLRDQVNRLTDMAEGLQDYARLRSQTLKLETKNVHLLELANNILPAFKKAFEEKHISLKLEIPESLTIICDPKLIERVFNNLIDNSIRYSQAKNLTIRATSEKIIFSDDGVGIPAQHLQDIFERFFRLEKSRNRATGGLGLGLAIVREIVEAHGWKIHALIPANNKGVEFTITLNKQA